MSWGNSREAYGWASIALHWIAAAGVIAMFATGIPAGIAGEAGDRATRGALMGLHVSIGATLFAFFAARIALHYAQPRPAKPPQAAWLNFIASATQNLLLLGLLIQIVSGPLAVWSGGRAINMFDLVTLPSPFPARAQSVHEAAEIAHMIGRVIIFFVLPLHVLGALKHLIFDRDGVFTRMLWPSRLKKSA
jgi:cytochrome b561